MAVLGSKCEAQETSYFSGVVGYCDYVKGHKGEHRFVQSKSSPSMPTTSSPRPVPDRRYLPDRSHTQPSQRKMLRVTQGRRLLLVLASRLADSDSPRNLRYRIALWLQTLALRSLVGQVQTLPLQVQQQLFPDLVEGTGLDDRDH